MDNFSNNKHVPSSLLCVNWSDLVGCSIFCYCKLRTIGENACQVKVVVTETVLFLN